MAECPIVDSKSKSINYENKKGTRVYERDARQVYPFRLGHQASASSEGNFDVLEGFLTVFIGERITIVELLESEGSQLSAEDKFTMSPAERHAYDEHLSAIMSKTTYLIPLS